MRRGTRVAHEQNGAWCRREEAAAAAREGEGGGKKEVYIFSKSYLNSPCLLFKINLNGEIQSYYIAIKILNVKLYTIYNIQYSMDGRNWLPLFFTRCPCPQR